MVGVAISSVTTETIEENCSSLREKKRQKSLDVCHDDIELFSVLLCNLQASFVIFIAHLYDIFSNSMSPKDIVESESLIKTRRVSNPLHSPLCDFPNRSHPPQILVTKIK